MKQKRIHSPSSILTYKQGEGFKWGCPRKYFLRYIKRLRQKPKPALIIGDIVHKTIEEITRSYHKEMLDWDYQTFRAWVLKTLKKRWDLKKQEIAALSHNQFHYSKLLKDSEMMLINWLHQFIKDIIQAGAPPFAETRIVSKTHGVQGIIDAIYPGEILDYKTSRSQEITPDIKLQLAIYTLLYHEQFGKLPERVGIHFLKFPSGDKNPRRFKPTQKLINYAIQEIALMHQLTQSDKESDYPCLCGGRCEEEFI